MPPAKYYSNFHHVQSESNSNYGFFLSIWDRIFHSYTPTAIETQQQMPLGLKEITGERTINLLQLLKEPFVVQNRRKVAE